MDIAILLLALLIAAYELMPRRKDEHHPHAPEDHSVTVVAEADGPPLPQTMLGNTIHAPFRVNSGSLTPGSQTLGGGSGPIDASFRVNSGSLVQGPPPT